MQTKEEVKTQEFNKERRSDLTKIDPRAIVVDYNKNERGVYKGIEELKESIKVNGVKQPIQGYRDKNGHIILTFGFRRMTAVNQLLDEGYDIAYVPIILEPRKYTEEQRLIDRFIENDDEPFTPLEEGELFLQLENFGYNQSEIAQKTGKNQASISNKLMLAKAPKDFKNKINEEKVSSSAVLEVLRETDNEDEQREMLEKGLEKAENEGTKKKATAKTFKPKSKKPVEKMKDALEQAYQEGVENEKTDFLHEMISKLENKEDVEAITEILK